MPASWKERKNVKERKGGRYKGRHRSRESPREEKKQNIKL